MHRMCQYAVLILFAHLFCPLECLAQGPDTQPNPIASLPWQSGPVTGQLGDVATVKVPADYRFVDSAGARKFLELLENPTDGSELGVLVSPDKSWFVVFEFSADGYVKDDDRSLDADALLNSIRQGTEQANELRKRRGWGTISVDGWEQKPFYDSQTQNLTWAIRGRSQESVSINHSTRLLGRRGVMKVNLVLSPDDLGNALPAFKTVLGGVSFNAGQRYAEFQRGDKIAEYGLAGLVVGGTGVALMKTGLLQKFWKLLVLVGIAAAGVLKRVIAKLFGRSAPADEPANV